MKSLLRMLLIFFSCLLSASAATPDPAVRTANRLLSAAKDPKRSDWFDVETWFSAMLPALPVRVWEIQVGGPNSPENVRLDAMPYSILDDGIQDSEWAEIRSMGMAELRGFLAAADCKTDGRSSSHLASAHPDPDQTLFWPHRLQLLRLVQVGLTCEKQVWVSVGKKVALPFTVTALELSESADGWRIAGLLTDRTADLWQDLEMQVERDVEAEEAEAKAVAAALASEDMPFLERWTPPVFPSKPALKSNDLNGDGKPDLLMPMEDQFGLLLGTKWLRLPGLSPQIAGDLDGDGQSDLVRALPGHYERGTADLRGTVTVFRGGTQMDLSQPTTLIAPEEMDARFGERLVAPGDLNGDGYADLVLAGRDGTEVYVYFGGALQEAGALLRLPAGASLTALEAAGDVEGDGFADFWMRLHREDRDRAVLLHGGRLPRLRQMDELAPFWPMAAVNLDGDRRSELIGISDQELAIYQVPTSRIQTWKLPQRSCRAVTAADFDADGAVELVVGCAWADQERGAVYLFSASGEERAVLHGKTPGERFGRELFVPGDLDGDGLPDLLVVDRAGASLFSRPMTSTTATKTWLLRDAMPPP